MLRKRPSRDSASKVSTKLRPTWTTGRNAGPTPDSRHYQRQWRPCSPKKTRLLPLEPFRYYQYGKRKVNLDGCVEVDAAYYSAPPGWIGQEVPVQWDHRYVRLLHPQTGELLREHLPQVRGKHRIKDEDRPKQHTAGDTTPAAARRPGRPADWNRVPQDV